MNRFEQVKKIASSLGFLQEDETLISLDSLGMIDFVVALEAETGVKLPAASLREESFESIAGIVELLEQFAKS